jgi:hypothetical protein
MSYIDRLLSLSKEELSAAVLKKIYDARNELLNDPARFQLLKMYEDDPSGSPFSEIDECDLTIDGVLIDSDKRECTAQVAWSAYSSSHSSARRPGAILPPTPVFLSPLRADAQPTSSSITGAT